MHSRFYLVVPLSRPPPDKDWEDIRFGVENKVDYYALSFVKDAQVVLQLKEYLKGACCTAWHRMVLHRITSLCEALHSTARHHIAVSVFHMSLHLTLDILPPLPFLPFLPPNPHQASAQASACPLTPCPSSFCAACADASVPFLPLHIPIPCACTF
ncbi:unnamed protein product [Closterium sp. NIES-54]